MASIAVWSALRRRDPGLATVRRAARVALVACVGFYACRYGLHNPVLATYALFGTIALGALSQIPGTATQRARTLLAVLPVGAVLVSAGTLLSVANWSAALGMFVLGFLVSYAGVGGPRLVGLASGMQLLYILPCFPPYDPGSLGYRLAGLALAVVLLAVAELALWPDRPPVPYERRFGDAVLRARRLPGRPRRRRGRRPERPGPGGGPAAGGFRGGGGDPAVPAAADPAPSLGWPAGPRAQPGRRHGPAGPGPQCRPVLRGRPGAAGRRRGRDAAARGRGERPRGSRLAARRRAGTRDRGDRRGAGGVPGRPDARGTRRGAPRPAAARVARPRRRGRGQGAGHRRPGGSRGADPRGQHAGGGPARAVLVRQPAHDLAVVAPVPRAPDAPVGVLPRGVAVGAGARRGPAAGRRAGSVARLLGAAGHADPAAYLRRRHPFRAAPGARRYGHRRGAGGRAAGGGHPATGVCGRPPAGDAARLRRRPAARPGVGAGAVHPGDRDGLRPGGAGGLAAGRGPGARRRDRCRDRGAHRAVRVAPRGCRRTAPGDGELPGRLRRRRTGDGRGADRGRRALAGPAGGSAKRPARRGRRTRCTRANGATRVRRRWTGRPR